MWNDRFKQDEPFPSRSRSHPSSKHATTSEFILDRPGATAAAAAAAAATATATAASDADIGSSSNVLSASGWYAHLVHDRTRFAAFIGPLLPSSSTAVVLLRQPLTANVDDRSSTGRDPGPPYLHRGRLPASAIVGALVPRLARPWRSDDLSDPSQVSRRGHPRRWRPASSLRPQSSFRSAISVRRSPSADGTSAPSTVRSSFRSGWTRPRRRRARDEPRSVRVGRRRRRTRSRSTSPSSDSARATSPSVDDVPLPTEPAPASSGSVVVRSVGAASGRDGRYRPNTTTSTVHDRPRTIGHDLEPTGQARCDGPAACRAGHDLRPVLASAGRRRAIIIHLGRDPRSSRRPHPRTVVRVIPRPRHRTSSPSSAGGGSNVRPGLQWCFLLGLLHTLP